MKINKLLQQKLALLSGTSEASKLILGDFENILELQKAYPIANDGAIATVSDTGTLYTFNEEDQTWNAGVGGGGIASLLDDLTPQLGGDLDLNGNDITGSGNISTVGDIVTNTGLVSGVILAVANTSTFGGTIDITGNVTLTGTVDGRNIATDGTKLDNIELLADVTDEANVLAALNGATIPDAGVPTSVDKILIQDASDSDNLKYVNVSDLPSSGGADAISLQGEPINATTPTGGQVLAYVSSQWQAVTLGLTNDHGGLSGLADDDHTQYHNDGRADTWLATKDTNDLTEGTNLYYTEARVIANTDVSQNTTHRSLTTNPHFVTLDQVIAQDVATDVTGLELEELTDGSTSDLHKHNANGIEYDNSDNVISLGDDVQLALDSLEARLNVRETVIIDHGDLSGLADDDHIQYHNDARALVWLDSRSTSDLPEGTNLYYTDERVDDRVNALIVDGTNITTVYDDGAGTLTINSTGGSGLTDIVNDVTPQLGGTLDLNGNLVGAASAADLTKLAALTSTAVELNYTDGVTSNIQTQLDTKTTVSTGAGTPGSTPTKEGDIYIDTTDDIIYISTGSASSADWQEQVLVNGTGLVDGDLLQFETSTSSFIKDPKTVGTVATTTIDMNSNSGNYYSTTTVSTAASYTLSNFKPGGKSTIRIQNATVGGPAFTGTGLTVTKKGDWTTNYEVAKVNTILIEMLTATLAWAWITAVD